MKPMSFGEYQVWRRENVKSEDGLAWFPMGKHKPKMSPEEAMAYYNMKLFDAWMELGYIKSECVKKSAWKDFWHAAEATIRHLPPHTQAAIREVFAYGYVLGYEKGKECTLHAEK